ncbi:hypothetical protein Shell_0543 [Staphylothermus hellenicus DSM 12710]|uniref:Uncharacterized protein n=2 Tax=Staphylothermus hellenicus TaxID=84599 RepID=D7DBX6_STAHD|nr:hypothetical protein Shell_0543 [Staphylothermus hellenicus DSM 12710]
MALLRELERFRRIIARLPRDEKARWEEILEGIEDTMSIYSDVPITDPLEIIYFHILRRLLRDDVS